MNIGMQIGSPSFSENANKQFDVFLNATLAIINTAASDAVKLGAITELRKASGLTVSDVSINNCNIDGSIHNHYNEENEDTGP